MFVASWCGRFSCEAGAVRLFVSGTACEWCLGASAFGGAKRTVEETCRCALQIGQPAFSGKPDKLGIRSRAGLGLYEIVIVLNSLHAEIEI